MDEAHGGGSAHVLLGRLDPLVTCLRVRHVLRILRANFSDVVDLVTQRVRIVPVVDGFLA